MGDLSNAKIPITRLWAAMIPYVTVVIGYYFLRNVWIAFGVYHIAIVAVLAIYGELGQFRRLKKGFYLKSVLLSTLPCLSAGILIVVLWPVATIDGLDLAAELNSVGLVGSLWYVMIAYSFVINPWFEEAFWRGFLGSDSKSPVITDFLFAGYHVLVLVMFLKWQWVIVGAVLLVAGGWLWRQLCTKYNGLAIAGLTHLAADIGIIAAIHYLRVSL